MWDFNVCLMGISRQQPAKDSVFAGWDVGELSRPEEKGENLQCSLPSVSKQQVQLGNPDHRVALGELADIPLLSASAASLQGTTTGDNPQFLAHFWELALIDPAWDFFQGSVNEVKDFGGCEYVVRWEQGEGELSRSSEARVQGLSALGKRGIVVSQMGDLPATRYGSRFFSMNTAVFLPNKEEHLPALWALCSSGEFTPQVRAIDQALKVTNASLVKIPFDLVYWQKVAAEKYPHGLPKPFSSDPTQWLFNGHPAETNQAMQVAVARLVGYLWPRQTGSSFPDCPALDPDNLAALADQDGIVCLSPVRGEAGAAERLRSLLAAAFGEEWSSAKERELLLETAVANDAKKAAADLGDWLRQNFFAEHCKLFQSRPFIWQIWDGNPNGFSALVNYHKLAAPKGQGRKTLELLTYTYLGDWIDRQKLDQAEGVNGADDRLAAALDLQGQLKKILDGEPPYDIFVRWKPLHQQAIGWDPDINDGVRLNIRPFLAAQLRKGGKAGAGILRAKPGTIKWAKDRGKEPMRAKDEFPWFWGWDETDPTLATDFGSPIAGAPPAGNGFDGNRWNDLHYSRAAKDAARARHRGVS